MAPPHSKIALVLIAMLVPEETMAVATITSSVTTVTAGAAPPAMTFTIKETAAIVSTETIVITGADLFGGVTATAQCTTVVDAAASPTDLCGGSACSCAVGTNALTITLAANAVTDGAGGGGYTVVAAVKATAFKLAPATAGAVNVNVDWDSTVTNSLLVYTSQTQVASTGVTLTYTPPITGTNVEGATIAFTPTTTMATNTDKLTLTATPSVVIKAGPTPIPTPNCVATMGGTTQTTSCAVTSSRALEVTFANANTVNINGAVSIVLNQLGGIAVFEQHVTSGTSVTFSMLTSTDLAAVTSISGWTTQAAAAGSDPVANVGGVARKFTLPPGDLIPLIVGPDVSLDGSTFEGMGPWEQWFGRMVVFSANRDRWLQIGIKKDILMFNHSLNVRNAFETLDVMIGYGDINNPQPGSATIVSDRNFDLPLGFLGVKVTFRVVYRHHRVPAVSIGRARRECADVMSETLHFFICSSPANEYFGWQRHLAIQFAHLDVAVLEITNATSIDGLLPQLWGIKPLSEENAKFLDDAPDAMAANTTPSSMPETTAWAGGKTPEDLQMLVAEPTETDIAI